MAAGAALYLVGGPLLMLLLAAFRGPADFLPFEPGSRWTLEHLRALVADPVLYAGILPDTLTFVLGSVALTSAIAPSRKSMCAN